MSGSRIWLSIMAFLVGIGFVPLAVVGLLVPDVMPERSALGARLCLAVLSVLLVLIWVAVFRRRAGRQYVFTSRMLLSFFGLMSGFAWAYLAFALGVLDRQQVLLMPANAFVGYLGGLVVLVALWSVVFFKTRRRHHQAMETAQTS